LKTVNALLALNVRVETWPPAPKSANTRRSVVACALATEAAASRTPVTPARRVNILFIDLRICTPFVAPLPHAHSAHWRDSRLKSWDSPVGVNR
jgi:hypothetical protein